MRILKTLSCIFIAAMLTNCGSSDPEIIPDLDAPIISININDGASGIAQNISIIITSSEQMHHDNGVEITNDALESLILFEDSDAIGVPYTAAIDNAGLEVTITPLDLLNPGEEYFLRFESISDEHGNTSESHAITFTVESFDFTNLLSKWSVSSENYSSFNESGTLIEGPIITEFDINEYTVDFDGTTNAGSFKQVLLDNGQLVYGVTWILGNYQMNPSDTTIGIEVTNGRGLIPNQTVIKILDMNGMSATFLVTQEVTIGTDIIRQERNLTLKKNDSDVPTIALNELIGEWSVTSLFEEEFHENSEKPGEFIFFSDYTLTALPHDRFTFNFLEDNNLRRIDTYYQSIWDIGEFEAFDESNFFFAYGNSNEQFLHLVSRPNDDQIGLKVFSYNTDENNNSLMFITEYQLERNDGTEFTTTLNELIGSWLVTDFVAREDGVDVTDPNDEDTPAGTTTTFNSDLTGTSENGTRVNELTYILVDGNTLEIKVTDEMEIDDLLFHIASMEMINGTDQLRIETGMVDNEEGCSANCTKVLFEFELVLERQ